MRRRRTERGFTLVELMVSLVLFSFAIAGVLAIAVSMAQGYREQRQIVETETNARGALDFIADSLRMASPGVRSGVVRTDDGTELIIDPDTTKYVENAMSLPAGSCVQNGSIRVQNNAGLNGSDILDVVFASGPVVTTLTQAWTVGDSELDVVTNEGFAEGDTVLLTDGNDGRLVRVDALEGTDELELEAPQCTMSAPSTAYAAKTTLVIRALHARFYLVNDSAEGISTALWMDPDADGPLPGEPLADWIEDFQVAVGIDENDDGTILDNEWARSNTLVTSAPSTFTPGRKLYAVRITLVARPASALVATTATYYKPEIEDHAPSGPADTLRRRVLSTTVEIRNLQDSP